MNEYFFNIEILNKICNLITSFLYSLDTLDYIKIFDKNSLEYNKKEYSSSSSHNESSYSSA